MTFISEVCAKDLD